MLGVLLSKIIFNVSEVWVVCTLLSIAKLAKTQNI